VLNDRDVEIRVRDELPELQAVVDDLMRATASDSPVPDALSGRGVTVERMRRFAEAAKTFYEAAPWRHLTNDDVIRVEVPRVGEGLSHVTIMGGGGREFGLAFLESPDDLEDLAGGLEPSEFFKDRPRWSVSYGPIWELPFGDVDLFEDAHLPVAAPEGYPIAFEASLDERPARPDAPTLGFFEGLLRALAETSEDELDRGRWTRSVTTADGAMKFKLALCDLVDKPKRSRRVPDRRVMESLLRGMEKTLASGQFESVEEANQVLQAKFAGRAFDQTPSSAETPLEKAQELVYQAFEAHGRRQLQLIRRALALSADCADAYVLLAERTANRDEALDLYAKGVAAGERALGAQVFAEDVGHFWGAVHTRPYMRARFGLAQTLQALGRADEAIEHYRELLRLNPNDNQGVREVLLPLLLEIGRDAEAGDLLQQYADDVTAMWAYAWALWTFRKESNSPAARERLRAAVKSSRHTVRYLLADPDTYDDDFDSYALGSEEEAIACARELGEAWRKTPGAMAWLKSNRGDGDPKNRKKARRHR